MPITSAKCIKTLSLLATLILVWGYSQRGGAACSPWGASVITIDVGNILVQRDTANLAPLTNIIYGSDSGYMCFNMEAYDFYFGVKSDASADTGKKYGSGKIFTSNVAGIGLTVGGNGSWVGETTSWLGDYFVNLQRNPGLPHPSLKIRPQIQLIQIGNVTNGVLSGKVGALATSTNIPDPEIPIYITGTVTKVACSLDSTVINVPMGDISATKFSGVGSTAGDKSFDLGLSCDNGANINVSLAGSQNTDTNDTSVLALTNAGQNGTASGVGVQLLYGGTPLKINNNLLLKTSAGGQETLAFSARYYQTQTTVGSGLANSSATLNITYQ